MENKTAQRWLVILGALLALGQAGCSTPPVPDVPADQPETAWWAYQDCMDSLPANASDTLCDKVGTTRSIPRYSYTGGTASGTTGPASGTTGGRGPYSTKASLTLSSTSSSSLSAPAAVSAPTRAQLDQAYREYLRSLDTATQAELAARWSALSKQAN